MKAAFIRIRIEASEKEDIKAFAKRGHMSISDVLRRAVATAICGDVPGKHQRDSCAAARRAANSLLSVLDAKPIEIGRLRVAVSNLRTVANELVQCR